MKSKRMRSALLYLCFVLISAILWSFLTLNKFDNYDVDVELKVSVPPNVKFLTRLPDKITVTVYEKGTSYILQMMNMPQVTLRFDDYSDGAGNFKVDQSQLRKVIVRLLRNSSRITSILPETINARYTDQPGKKVPVVLKMDVIPAMHHAITGPAKLSQDSVVIFGDAEVLKNISEAYTYQVTDKDLKDTLSRKVQMAPIPHVIIEPQYINIMLPIDRLVSMTQRVPVSVRNTPPGVRVVVFPSTLNVTFRAPQSMKLNSSSSNEVTAVVDYNNIDLNSKGNKVVVQVGEAPGAYVDVKLSEDSVEYIIERY